MRCLWTRDDRAEPDILSLDSAPMVGDIILEDNLVKHVVTSREWILDDRQVPFVAALNIITTKS
jgi:hypothetical protein